MMTRSDPIRSGIGLRAPHMRALLTSNSLEMGFLEAHAENFFGGGANRRALQTLSDRLPLSLHGVGLSLGRADALDRDHLAQLAGLVRAVNPFLVSEHLAWSGFGGRYVPDLLPLPLTSASLTLFADHVDQVQTAIQRPILIENPSAYIAFAGDSYDEPGFLTALVQRCGCGLLLDVNNVAVSAHNLGFDPLAYLAGLPATGAVRQYHLAGYQVNPLASGGTVWIDTHGQPVYPEVWDLYRVALRRFGDQPTLIEWDSAIPALERLVAEAALADAIRDALRAEGDHDQAA